MDPVPSVHGILRVSPAADDASCRDGAKEGPDFGRPTSRVPAVPGCGAGPESPVAKAAAAGSKRKRDEQEHRDGTEPGRKKGAGAGQGSDGGSGEASDDGEDEEGDDDAEEDTPNQMFSLYENFRRSKGKVEKLRGTLRAGVVNLGGRDFAFGGAQSAFDWG